MENNQVDIFSDIQVHKHFVSCLCFCKDTAKKQSEMHVFDCLLKNLKLFKEDRPKMSYNYVSAFDLPMGGVTLI